MIVYEIQNMIRSNGRVVVQIGDKSIELRLNAIHERFYAMRCMGDFKYPQMDLDFMIFQRFVKDGDLILDAGANIGVTSLQLHSIAPKSRIVAIEPLPSLAKRIRSLDVDAINVQETALGESVGRIDLYLSGTHTQGNTIKTETVDMFPTVFGEKPEKISVPITTLDILTSQYGRFDVWKLDIEGAEVDALKGGINTILKHPPRIIIAELYGAAVREFYERVKETHPHAMRFAISNPDYNLVGLPPFSSDPSGDDNFHRTAPMYVFSSQEL